MNHSFVKQRLNDGRAETMAGLRPTFENVFGAQRMMNGNLVRTAEQATQVKPHCYCS